MSSLLYVVQQIPANPGQGFINLQNKKLPNYSKQREGQSVGTSTNLWTSNYRWSFRSNVNFLSIFSITFFLSIFFLLATILFKFPFSCLFHAFFHICFPFIFNFIPYTIYILNSIPIPSSYPILIIIIPFNLPVPFQVLMVPTSSSTIYLTTSRTLTLCRCSLPLVQSSAPRSSSTKSQVWASALDSCLLIMPCQHRALYRPWTGFRWVPRGWRCSWRNRRKAIGHTSSFKKCCKYECKCQLNISAEVDWLKVNPFKSCMKVNEYQDETLRSNKVLSMTQISPYLHPVLASGVPSQESPCSDIIVPILYFPLWRYN